MAPGTEHPEQPAEGGDAQVDGGGDATGTTDGLTAEPRADEEAGSASGSDADAQAAAGDTQPEPS